jgi:cob(I)alamin adenosyltransferase
MKKGLIIINTGNGKGKTTAALGLAFRALGHNFKVCMVQFIKGSWKYGELESAKKFENFTLLPMGKGFVNFGAKEPDPKDTELAEETLAKGKDAINSGEYKLVILDEILYALCYNLIKIEDVLEIVKNKPDNVHVVLTGRGLDKFPELIKVADLVTEMKEIKHPYQQGITAQRGIEF